MFTQTVHLKKGVTSVVRDASWHRLHPMDPAGQGSFGTSNESATARHRSGGVSEVPA